MDNVDDQVQCQESLLFCINKKWEEEGRQKTEKDMKIEERKEFKEGDKQKRQKLAWVKWCTGKIIFQGTFWADMNGNDAVAQERNIWNHCSFYTEKILQLKFYLVIFLWEMVKSNQSLNTVTYCKSLGSAHSLDECQAVISELQNSNSWSAECGSAWENLSSYPQFSHFFLYCPIKASRWSPRIFSVCSSHCTLFFFNIKHFHFWLHGHKF